MPKNIVICSDGTGNSTVKGRGTNVFKLFEAVDLNGHRTDPGLTPQVALYDDGVGTDSFLPLKLLGGAFGWGLKRNVLKLYTGLVRIYDPGDCIYLLGFSRGAFTVRTLAGMIANCGVLEAQDTTDEMRDAVADAYSAYRKRYCTLLLRKVQRKSPEAVNKSADEEMEKFKTRWKPRPAQIHFLGVWDTVDSVGGPFHISDVINTFVHQFKFPDHKLSDKIEYAAHALSIDDARAAFEPLLWEGQPNVEQVWFSGVHSNVGGGYPKQGMSLVTLDWMMHKASERGLRVLDSDRIFYRDHSTVDDKLYDSRAGLGVCYRWKPRDMDKLWRRSKGKGDPKVHVSVLERIAHGTDGYAPGTLSGKVKVVYTPSSDPEQNKASEIRARAVDTAVEKAFELRGDELVPVLCSTEGLGQIANYIYLVSSLVFAVTAARSACVLVVAAVAGKFQAQLSNVLRTPTYAWLAAASVAGLIVAAALARCVDHRRSLACSRFWHHSRQELRGALKAARKSMLDDESRTDQPVAPDEKRSAAAGGN